MLVRVFYTEDGTHHKDEEFSIDNRNPENELNLYTWSIFFNQFYLPKYLFSLQIQARCLNERNLCIYKNESWNSKETIQ